MFGRKLSAKYFGILLRSCARKIILKNPSIFVKHTAEKSLAPFLCDTVYTSATVGLSQCHHLYRNNEQTHILNIG